MVFETLFGDSGSTDRAARAARLAQQKSILDSVNEELATTSATTCNQPTNKRETIAEPRKAVDAGCRTVTFWPE